MHVVELERSLRQLHLSGMATVLETRLRQAQAEAMAPIDLIACWYRMSLRFAPTDYCSAAANKPGFVIPTKRSIISISTSIRTNSRSGIRHAIARESFRHARFAWAFPAGYESSRSSAPGPSKIVPTAHLRAHCRNEETAVRRAGYDRSASTRVTRWLGILVSVSSARHSRVKVSTTLNTRSRCPLAVTSLAKSIAHSWFGAVSGWAAAGVVRVRRLRRMRRTQSPARDTRAALAYG